MAVTGVYLLVVGNENHSSSPELFTTPPVACLLTWCSNSLYLSIYSAVLHYGHAGAPNTKIIKVRVVS